MRGGGGETPVSAGAVATVTEADGVVSFTLVVRRKGEEGDLSARAKV